MFETYSPGLHDTLAVAPKNKVEPESTPSLSHRVPNPFTTDRYFAFMFSEQDIRWEEVERRKVIEAKYSGRQNDANKQTEIRSMLTDTGKARKALFARYGITPDQYAALHANPEAKKERSVYLRFNKPVRDRLDQYHQRQKHIQEFYESLK